MIRNEHLKLWHKDEEEIREIALKNTPELLPAAIWTMKDMLGEMGVDTENLSEETPMYILSNKSRINGASAMLYDGVLRKFAGNLGSDLFILPSSVHELILVPVCDTLSPSDLIEMIAEVNDTQVSAEEILSYSLYEYSRENDGTMTVDLKKVASAS